jgi:hypothetical protein
MRGPELFRCSHEEAYHTAKMKLKPGSVIQRMNTDEATRYLAKMSHVHLPAGSQVVFDAYAQEMVVIDPKDAEEFLR